MIGSTRSVRVNAYALPVDMREDPHGQYSTKVSNNDSDLILSTISQQD